MSDLPKLLRLIRTINGWTQQDLAVRIGVSRSSVANAEAGRQDFPASKLLPILADQDLLVDVHNPHLQVSAVMDRLHKTAGLLAAKEREVALLRAAVEGAREALAGVTP